METYSASLQAVKCCSVFGFSVSEAEMTVSSVSLSSDSKMMAASLRPTTVHVAHSFSNRAFHSSVTTPSTAPLPLRYPQPPFLKKHSSCYDWLKSLTPQDSSPIYGHTSPLKARGGGAIKHTRHSHSHTYKPMQKL